jgi:hypothetical protein
LLQRGIRLGGHQLGQFPSLGLVQFSDRTATVRARRQIASVTALLEQQVDVPFGHLEDLGDFLNGAALLIYGINDALAQF